MLSDKDLLARLKPFTDEDEKASIWGVLVTLGPYVFSLGLLIAPVYWALKLAGACLFILINLRLFSLYHDYVHGAILRRRTVLTKPLRLLLDFYGYSILVSKNSWAESHNRHHQNNSRLNRIFVGQISIYDTLVYQELSATKKLGYYLLRHPLMLPLGYFTAFLLPLFVQVFQRPGRNFRLLIGVGMHAGALIGIYRFAGLEATVLFFACEMSILAALKYLFHAQHTFPGARYLQEAQWTMVQASLHSTSFFEMSRLMHWFTGNIGYHHVHHLNVKIPYYRLPAVMAALPELQNPPVTSWHPRDVMGVIFSTNLWDEQNQTLVGFRAVPQLNPRREFAD